MAAKKVTIENEAQLYGLIKMLNYADKHGFIADPGTYKIVKKHPRSSMKDIGPNGRTRNHTSQDEWCEVMEVILSRKGRQSVKGYLIAYKKGIRFDANEKF